MIAIISLSILVHSVTAVHKFYTHTSANTFGDFSLGAGYDINRFQPKANHVFRESKNDLLYDIMPITSTKTRCSLVASQKDIRDKLFVYGSVSVKYKMISGSGSITYDSRKESMNKVAYYRCTVDRTLFTISLNVPEITEDWNPKDYIPSDLLALNSEEEIIDEIGDYHIRSITYGRRYNTEIRIEYASEDSYNLLKGELKAEIGMGFLKVTAEVKLKLESESFEEDLTMSVGSEALGFIEAQPLYLPSQTLSRKLPDGTIEQVSINDQIDEMIEKNLKAFNEIDAQGKIEPKTGLSKSELFQEIGDAYPLWYSVDKNLRYFKDKLTKLSAFEEEQMLRNLDQAYDIMRELEDMTENIEVRAEELFNSYHLLSGATDLSLEFLKYRQGLMDTILEYRQEVIDYIQQPAKKLAAKDIYFWAATDQEIDRQLQHISMDVLATKIWDLLGMEDVEMEDDNEIGSACLFNGVQATIEGDNRRRKFAGRVVFGSLTVRHVLFDVDGKVVSLGYIDHEDANSDDETWTGVAHELVFVREDCTLLKTGSDVWYHGARYKISAIGSDEHLTKRGYVNKDKLTNVRMHLQPQDTTRQIEVVITDAEVRDVELRGTESSGGFTVDAEDRLMYQNGYVCDKDFQKYEANMICTNLGYADVLYYQTGFKIPAANAWGRPRITMVDLNCPALAFMLNECTFKSGEDMDEKLWGSCKTQNGVQLKCVNEYIPGEENANMEVISETVSCVRNEDSMGKKIDTAESCSGAEGDADTFGLVQKVVVKGDICVKLYNNQRLECVISEKSSDWDFTLPDTLARFCYDTYEQSFPDQIEMMPARRPERCADQVPLLQTRAMSYMKDGIEVPIVDCDTPKADGLCVSNNELDSEEQSLFNAACFKTCTECIPNTRKHYQIKVVPNAASFALNDNVRIPVQVTLKGGPQDSDQSNWFHDIDEYVFDGDYECGTRIQLIATAQHSYDHGDVLCSMVMISTDGRIDVDGNVIVSGDVEVNFECINPPSSTPSVSPSIAPGIFPSRQPITSQPTTAPSMLPTDRMTPCTLAETTFTIDETIDGNSGAMSYFAIVNVPGPYYVFQQNPGTCSYKELSFGVNQNTRKLYVGMCGVGTSETVAALPDGVNAIAMKYHAYGELEIWANGAKLDLLHSQINGRAFSSSSIFQSSCSDQIKVYNRALSQNELETMTALTSVSTIATPDSEYDHIGWASYAVARNHCTNQNKVLCSYSEYCPNGVGGEPLRGRGSGADVWAPIGDLTNDWVQISSSAMCRRHSTLAGLPTWGSAHNGGCCNNNEVLCCTLTTPRLLSEEKPTSSSTLVDANSISWSASNAVQEIDNLGNHCTWNNPGSVAIAAGTDLFWQVDLEDVFAIKTVKILGFNLGGYSDNVQFNVCNDAAGNDCTACGGLVSATPGSWVQTSCSLNGRFIRLINQNSDGKPWHFCRIAVYGVGPA